MPPGSRAKAYRARCTQKVPANDFALGSIASATPVVHVALGAQLTVKVDDLDERAVLEGLPRGGSRPGPFGLTHMVRVTRCPRQRTNQSIRAVQRRCLVAKIQHTYSAERYVCIHTCVKAVFQR